MPESAAPVRFPDPERYTSAREANHRLAAILHGFEGDSEIHKIDREAADPQTGLGAWLITYK